MIIIDAAIFILIVAGLHLYKANHPNFLFFCKGAILFLPPDDEEQQGKQEEDKGKKSVEKDPRGKGKQGQQKQKQKKQHALPIIQVEYNQVKQYPFCTQFQRIVMTIVGLLGFYIFRLSLSFFLPPISHLPFYIVVALFIYILKVSVDIFMLSAYKSKTTFSIAFFLNLFFLILALTIGNLQDVYDQRSSQVTYDYVKFLEIILGNKKLTWINHNLIIGIVIFINFFITLAAIPSIVKFGNWYSKTLKQVYYNDQQNQQNLQKFIKPQKRQTTKQAEKQLKLHSKNIISLLNYYLISSLVFVFLSHRFLLYYVEETIVDCLRLVFFGVSVGIILWTVKDAVEYNGAFAYKFVLQYLNQKSKQGKQALRKKIIPYIYHIWYHFHQFLIRIMIPIVLIYLIIHWKYLSTDSSLQTSPISARQINYDIQCSINTNQFDLIKNLYKCPIKSYKQMEIQQNLITSNIISGIVSGQNPVQPPATIQDKIIEYGVLRKQFMVEFVEMILWYSNITIYGMTVIYVLFLRKTVYEI